MLNDIKKGEKLPKLKKIITQDKINLYAEATGMTDPIHTDPEIAKNTIFGSTIAHGATLLDYISEIMYASFGVSWLTNGTMDAKIIAPVKNNEKIVVEGNIDIIEIMPDGSKKVVCALNCSDSKRIVVHAIATVKLNGSLK